MAHVSCPLHHDMWNGDGKPDIWAFRIAFFDEYSKLHPDAVITDDADLCLKDPVNHEGDLYEFAYNYPGENPEIWYCDKCGGLVIFPTDDLAYDFLPVRIDSVARPSSWDPYEDYIAFRDWDYERFQDWSYGMSPAEAIHSYTYQYTYKVPKDMRYIFQINSHEEITGIWQRVNSICFHPTDEMIQKGVYGWVHDNSVGRGAYYCVMDLSPSERKCLVHKVDDPDDPDNPCRIDIVAAYDDLYQIVANPYFNVKPDNYYFIEKQLPPAAALYKVKLS